MLLLQAVSYLLSSTENGDTGRAGGEPWFGEGFSYHKLILDSYISYWLHCSVNSKCGSRFFTSSTPYISFCAKHTVKVLRKSFTFWMSSNNVVSRLGNTICSDLLSSKGKVKEINSRMHTKYVCINYPNVRNVQFDLQRCYSLLLRKDLCRL